MKTRPKIYMFQIDTKHFKLLIDSGFTVILRGWGEVKYAPSRLYFRDTDFSNDFVRLIKPLV